MARSCSSRSCCCRRRRLLTSKAVRLFLHASVVSDSSAMAAVREQLPKPPTPPVPPTRPSVPPGKEGKGGEMKLKDPGPAPRAKRKSNGDESFRVVYRLMQRSFKGSPTERKRIHFAREWVNQKQAALAKGQKCYCCDQVFGGGPDRPN